MTVRHGAAAGAAGAARGSGVRLRAYNTGENGASTDRCSQASWWRVGVWLSKYWNTLAGRQLRIGIFLAAGGLV